MNVRSLGYRTDLIFHAFDGEMVDRGEYLVIRTPSNPGFRWGNFVLFEHPPKPSDRERWLTVFRREIGAPPAVGHVVLAWDDPEGDVGGVAPFLDDGFRLLESVVLTAREVVPPARRGEPVEVRPLAEEWEFEAAVANQVACEDPGEGTEGFEVFARRRMARYRRMAGAGRGHWFGAFLGERLVADLGLFTDPTGELARFQTVQTHPDFRRRGVAGELVYQAARHGLEEMDVRTLVIVADEHYFAKDIYASVGFARTERQAGLERW